MSTDIYFKVVPIAAVYDDFVYWKQNPKNPREEYEAEDFDEFGPNYRKENHCLVEMGWHAQERAKKSNPNIPEYDGICRILPEDLDFLEQKIEEGLNLGEDEKRTKDMLMEFISSARRCILPWTQDRIDEEAARLEKNIEAAKKMNDEVDKDSLDMWLRDAEQAMARIKAHEVGKTEYALYMEQY